MRILATALTLGFGLTSEAVESVIDRVELHRSGATITRVVDVDLTPEAPQIGVEGLPANIDNQLRIHAAAGVEIRGVAVDIVRDTRAYNDAVTAKQNEIDIVETEIARLNDDSRIARLKLSFLQDAAAPENAEQIRPIDTWSETLDTLDRAATDAYARVRVNTAAIADQQRVLAKLIEELDALSGANSSSATVRFQATSSSSRRARIELSYYDHRAFWEPVYDASLDTRQRVLALDQRAQVSQWTGEDWTNVALVLGRNSPTSRADPPTVTSQFVTIAPPMYATRARQDNAVEEVVVTGNFALARAQPLSDRQQDLARLDTDFVARYVLPDRHSIPANRDKPRDVDIQQVRLPVDLYTRLVPRQTDTAFVMARLTPTLDLPSGNLSLYVDGRYTGVASATRLRVDQPIDLPMGPDERVAVRTTELGFEDGEIGFIGKRRIAGEAWAFEITNHHDAVVPIEVRDRIPISEDRDIEVTQPRGATPPDRTDVDDQPGVVAWDRDLGRGESTTIRHIYKVEHPVDTRLRYRDG